VNAEDTYNDFEQSVLDGLQLAYKVTCNSLYGQVGATTSPICYKELAACTTATGRRMVVTARDLTLQTFEGSSLVYGDTDSVFINFTGHIKMNNPGKDLTEYDLLVESIQMGVKAAKNINSHMKAPQNIEYEKTLWPFCIFSKKRYIGNLYEHDPKKYKLKYMGIVLKRRDNAPIVKTIYYGIMDKILNGSRSVEDSIRFFRSSVQDLLDGKVNISQLAISKSLKSEYANPTQIAHKVLADRMGERDPGNKPQSNDRIPYCYIDSSNLKCMVCKGSVNVEKCKCLGCMKMFCSTHLVRHKDTCIKVCRFCKLNEKETKLVKCGTCLAYYCGKCNTKHKTRVDGKTGQTHTDKCKKPLTSKILQGDILEHPQYINETGLKIDYRYYFDHQIWEPVRQIFALVSDTPDSIIADILRKNDNAKKGNHEITAWFAKMKQMSSPPPEPVVVPEVAEEKEEEEVASAGAGILPEKKMKKIPMKIESKFDVKCDVNAPVDVDDEDANMLAGDFEEDYNSDMDGMEMDECAFDMDA
jgi:DNA polymerase elongation subunit (family B)